MLAMGSEPKRGEMAPDKSESLEREREVLQERSDALRFEFVASELDLAITFCESAASTSNPQKSQTSMERAEEAFATAKRFLDGEHVDEPIRRTIEEKLARLEPLLNEWRRGK